MFRGRYEHAIDRKGRTSLPSRFREVLGGLGDDRLILTTGLEPCLVAYPMQTWLAFEQELSAKPQFDPSVLALKRIYVSGAIDLELDKLGRLLIPASLRKYAGLTREAVWAGMGSNIELWDKDTFYGIQQESLGDPQRRLEIQQRLSELGL